MEKSHWPTIMLQLLVTYVMTTWGKSQLLRGHLPYEITFSYQGSLSLFYHTVEVGAKSKRENRCSRKKGVACCSKVWFKGQTSWGPKKSFGTFKGLQGFTTLRKKPLSAQNTHRSTLMECERQPNTVLAKRAAACWGVRTILHYSKSRI